MTIPCHGTAQKSPFVNPFADAYLPLTLAFSADHVIVTATFSPVIHSPITFFQYLKRNILSVVCVSGSSRIIWVAAVDATLPTGCLRVTMIPRVSTQPLSDI